MTQRRFRFIAILGLLLVAINTGCTQAVIDAARSSTASFLSNLVNSAVNAAFDG